MEQADTPRTDPPLPDDPKPPADLDRWLDEALEDTFPASDPVAPRKVSKVTPARNCAGSPGAG